MIQIDMNKKRSMNVINKSFHLENDVLVLAVEPLEYELEGKTITAVFEPSKIETGALEVIDGVIQIPIYSSMIQVGVNFIQLNFRWDTTKLEQSGKLMWVIDKSLITEGAPQEDVDIISYLINEVKRVVGETGDIKEALDESTANANTINETLSNEVTGTIKIATTVGIDLEDTIEDANFTKGLLETTIDDSEVAKTDLEGTIVVAGNTQSNLNAKIGEATTSKQALDQAIIDNQIVKKSEFTAHKEDYANYIDSELDFVLRELPNGTKDEIRVSGNKAERVKRVSGNILKDSDIISYSQNATTNVARIITRVWDGNVTWASVSTSGGVYFNGMLESFGGNAVSWYADKLNSFATTSNQEIHIYVDKTVIKSLSEAKVAFTGLELTYQLATPTITELALGDLSPNTQQIVKLTSKVEKMTNAIIALGGTII